MAANKNELKFYLTSTDPLTTQSSLPQSIGGYQTLVEINPSILLNQNVDRTLANFTVSAPISSPFIQIGSEIMSISSSNGNNISVNRAQFSTANGSYLNGDSAFALQTNNLFNGSFDANQKQYRCIAIKNTGLNTFFDLKFYFKYLSLNTKTAISMAVEIPKTEILSGVSTGGSSISLVDGSLKNLFDDEYDNSVLVITSGSNINLGRKIASFDKVTGTFTFLTALPFAVGSGTKYRIDNSPSQRVISGTNAPTTGTIYTSNFQCPNSISNAISIDFSSIRINGVDLISQEIIYLWIQREITENVDSFDNNRVVLAASYKTS